MTVESEKGSKPTGVFSGWSKKGNLKLKVSGEMKYCKPSRIRDISVPEKAKVLKFTRNSN